MSGAPRDPAFAAADAWLDVLDEGLVLHDVRGGIVDCSAVAARLLGAGRDVLLGQATLFPHRDARTADGAPFPPDAEPVWAALRTGAPSAPVEVRVLREDGTEDWLTLRAALAAPGSAGGAPRPVTRVADASAARELARVLAAARRAEGAGRLAAHAVHDLNNALTVVLGYADVLAVDGTAGDDARRSLAEIRRAAERGARITARLLALGGGAPAEDAVHDLHRGIEELAPLLAQVAGEGVQVRLRLAARATGVRVAAAAVEQALLQLVANAREAMRGSGTIEIATADADLDAAFAAAHAGAAPGPHVALHVRDDGAGMDEGTRARALEPFFTTRADHGGLGLGLAIVGTVARRAGGAVELASTRGAGTTVTLWLPCAERPPDPGG